MTEIICIMANGKASVNKELVAKLLRGELEKADKRVLVARFADPLKLICRNWFDWDGRMDDAGRSLLRYIGTDVVRARLPDFWADFTLNLLSLLRDEWDYVIIPDSRYPNELDMSRYSFQPRQILIGERHSLEKMPGHMKPEFAIAYDDALDQLRSNIAAVVHRLLRG